jgi:hypothetical protein
VIAYLLYSAPIGTAGATLLADYSNRVRDLTLSTGERGFAECAGEVPLPLVDAFRLYDRPGLPWVYALDSALGVAFEGRLEDVALITDGVRLTALGAARALSDVPYTAFWTATDMTSMAADTRSTAQTAGPKCTRWIPRTGSSSG